MVVLPGYICMGSVGVPGVGWEVVAFCSVATVTLLEDSTAEIEVFVVVSFVIVVAGVVVDDALKDDELPVIGLVLFDSVDV